MGWIIGLDEVGRGPLAGPVAVGGVLVERPALNKWPVSGVRDSKALSPFKRTVISQQLKSVSTIDYCVLQEPAYQIDRLGISPVLGGLFRACILKLLAQAERWKAPIDAIIVDGDPLWTPAFLTGKADGPPVAFIRQGDAKEWVIGAASILAKVERDLVMMRLAEIHPGYGWEHNSGYGTAEHEAAIEKLGLTPQHRRTFCSKFLGGTEDALEMFAAPVDAKVHSG
jgi:ribonuclease HII